MTTWLKAINRPSGESFEVNLNSVQADSVSCMLEVFPFDLHDVGGYFCLWNHLFDNPASFNELTEIPDKLGLNFAFDGSSSAIQTTEPGTWAFTLTCGPPADETWKGAMLLDFGWYVGRQLGPFPDQTVSGIVEGVSTTVRLDAGYEFNPQFVTREAATLDPFNVDVYLHIVRLR